MREPLARYVFDHYRHLMTEQERLAYNPSGRDDESDSGTE
jgi:hypothetical protein